jgi:uncharacterized protein YhaN
VLISRLRVDGFRCLSGLDWRPARGFNLVFGPNESGKSTLAEALEALVFGVPGGAAGDVLRPWSGTTFGGRVELDCGRVAVAIERDFGTGAFRYDEVDTASGEAISPLTGQLRRGSSGPVAKRYRELFARQMGFFDEKLFRRSVFVPQGELIISARDLKEAAATLRSLASGGGTAYDRALQRLESRYYELTSEGDRRRRPGLLDRLRGEKAELGAHARSSEAHGRKVAALRGSAAQCEEELARLRAEADEASQLAERARERAELHRRRAALAAADLADRERLDAAEKAAAEVADAERRLAAFADLAGASGRFPQLVNRLRSTEAEVSRLTEAVSALTGGEQPRYPLWRNLAAAGGAALLGTAAAVAGGLTGSMALMAAGAAVGFGGLIAALLFAHFGRRSRRQAAGQLAALQKVESDLERSRGELNAARADLLQEVSGRLEFQDAALEELLRRYWERRDLESRAEAVRPGVMRPEELTDLRARSAETVREIAVLDERIEQRDGQLEVAETGAEPAEPPLAARASELQRAVRTREEALQEIRLQLAGLQSSGATQAAARDRLEQLEELIPRHEARCRSLRLASSELAASIGEFQEKHLEALGEVAGELLAGLTAGRYGRVDVDPESLLPAVSGAGREGLQDESLSQGTRAALYLALRLAMGKLVAGGRTMPLILDDPLVDLDDERRASALALLAKLGSQTQVILLSCDRRLADCGAEVLELGG